jgi:spermidine/putrescine-binding protein
MKRLVGILALAIAGIAAVMLAGAAGPSSGSTLSDSMVISTFGGATDVASTKYFYGPFSESTGVEVKMDPSSQQLVAKLRAAEQSNNVVWSLARANEEDAVVLAADGLLQPLPKALKKRLDKVSYPGAVTRYGITFLRSATVLLCNRAMVSRCPTTPREFWNTKTFKGPRTMFADGWVEGLIYALEADGVSQKHLFPLDVNRAFRSLDRIRGSINVWWANPGHGEQVFRDGQVAMGTIYDGRASLISSDNNNMKVSFRGAVATRELLVVPKNAPNPKAAWALIEWYATHARAQAQFTIERRNGLSNPKEFRYIPKSVSNSIASTPKNAAQAVRVDFAWVQKNRDRVYRRWQDWLTG